MYQSASGVANSIIVGGARLTIIHRRRSEYYMYRLSQEGRDKICYRNESDKSDITKSRM